MVNNNYLSQVFNVSGIPSLILSSNAPIFTIVEVNTAYLQVCQRTREDLIGKPLFEAFPDNPGDEMADGVYNLSRSLEKVINTCKPHQMPMQKYDIPIGDSNVFVEKYWKPENIPMLGENNETLYILHTVQDATEEIKKLQQLMPAAAPREMLIKENGIAAIVQMKQQIEASEKKYRYLFENNPAPMFIWDYKSLCVIDCNAEALKMYGYTKEEFLKLSMCDIRQEKADEFVKALTQEVDINEIAKKIVRHKKKNGDTISVNTKCNIIEYAGKNVSLIQVTDITDKENALLRLKNNELKLKTAQRLAKLGYWQIDITEKKVYWSDEVYFIWGLPKDSFELTYNFILYTIHPEDRHIFEEREAVSFMDEQEPNFEFRIVLPDLSVKWLYAKGNLSEKPAGNGYYLEGTVQDITAQKLLSLSLEESNQRYSYVTRATSDAIWDWNLLTDEIYWGAGVQKIFGYAEAEMVTDNSFWTKHIHPDDAKRVFGNLKEAIEGTEQTWNDEYRYLKADNTYAYVVDRGFLIRDEKGKATRMVGAMQDITKRKAEDERLKLLESVVTNTNDAVIIAEIKSIAEPIPSIVYVNRAFTRMTGYTEAEVIGLSTHILRGPNTDTEEMNRLDEAIRKQESCEITAIAYKKNGEEFWMNSSVCSMFDEKGMLTHWIAVQRDVTERIKAQEEIASQKKFNEDILNNMPSDIAVFDNQHNYLFLNSNAIANKETREWLIGKNDFDYCQKKGISNAVAFHRRELFNKAIKNRTVVDWIDQHKNSQGEATYIFRKFYPYFEQDKLKFVIGYGTDITERKKTEIELVKVLDEKNTILESIGDAFFAVDKQWVITYWNHHAEKILRKNRKDILGHNLWTVFSNSINNESYKKYHEAIETNKVIHFEDYYEVLEKWYEVSAYPSSSGLSVYFKDITQRKLIDQRIKSERNLLRTLIDNLPDTIYYKDTTARKLISNRVDYNLLGATTEDEVLGKTDLEVFPNDEGQTYYNEDLEILKTGKPLLNVEECFTREDKQPLWLLNSRLAIRNEQQEIIGLLGIGRDITERKIGDEKLKELNKQLEAHVNQLTLSNAELEQFAYVASHDLQEPLRMVTSFLTKLEKKYAPALDDTAKKYIHFAVDGSSRMRQIILDLLEFSKIGREEDKLEEVNLNELVGEILMLQRKQIQEKKAIVKVGRLPVLKTFSAPMRQIFQNLINNSLKYSDDTKTEVPKINITASETKKHWQFDVQDNGIGIDAQYFNKIFVIFQRLHNNESYSGTGVGLAITKKIVENMGGKIWVESEEGRGSTFHFTLLKQF